MCIPFGETGPGIPCWFPPSRPFFFLHWKSAETRREEYERRKERVFAPSGKPKAMVEGPEMLDDWPQRVC